MATRNVMIAEMFLKAGAAGIRPALAARLLATVLLLSSLPVTAGGPARDFPMFRGDDARTGYLREGPEPPLKLLWKFKTRKGAAEIDVYPAVDDGLSPATVRQGVVYVGGHDGWVYALDAATGEKRWEFATKGRVNSTPTWHDGLVVFGSMDGFIYALRAQDGSPVWKFAVGSKAFRGIGYGGVRTSPLIRDGIVYIGA